MEVTSSRSENKTHSEKKRGVDGREREDVPRDVYSDTGPVSVIKREFYYLGYFHIAEDKSGFTLPAGQDVHVNTLPHTSAEVQSLWGRNYTLRSPASL